MEWFSARPGRKIIVYFAAAIILGAILLVLPISSPSGHISIIDALFTSTSAICVTGLTVLDTGHDFTLFGQIVILILIQLGGLGIMTFATTLLISAGARLSFHDKLGLSQTFGTSLETKAKSILLAVLSTTLIVEFVGAVVMFFRFRHDFSVGRAIYVSIFHSVSAFCNAGFSLFTTSLENYEEDPVLILTFSALIILGGLGFVVIREVFDRIRYKKSGLSLHTKLCLTTTAVLLVGGTAAIFMSELNNMFTGTGLGYSLTNSFFQAVTARTAGFNTLTQGHLTEVSLLITIILMFIGASPGSTGGGIKTTTVAVIFLLAYNRFHGRRSVAAFKRSIDLDSIVRALTVVLLGIVVIVFMLAILMFTEQEVVAHRLSHGWFVDNLFETVSAFGTVGLSLGLTPHLNFIGKAILILTMFIGRVGLLTLAFSLVRPARRGEIVYVEEPVMVG